ncbi:iron-sulfur cluster carrier protein ApbC [Marinobacterium sp. xm-a-127]|uniref:iron-sulfur cluster carrier protein ApbC n=1 Tax=unclassified Marinobacterium TaxID=2644139 RepID=UPI0019E9B481|nr:Septum site-determining protein MinD [Marinobacterium sp. xm-a-152]NRP28077.1 Septum site-determining protein MinD [Marinobacterium sp. xm-d-420]NRP36252.1 Septum site-determining protein MinD [Marinobacterium sp. xm-d-579]NRP39269.1 Septum site-determining protein MinD [Marinobacterium sp. xm-a-121]NRP47330.1 Septum site-determining protein MinD [Marinobacterium sp. xm-d-543]NRP51899.1 Septum site-determining protein MinD [Marinobacterium sp. xm-v-242]NRP56948.1 Septum site-determining pr
MSQKLENLAGVKKIVAISSGKGGVGKSTVTANLAAALSVQGLRVGVLDADIYGPSQAMMFGVPAGTRPKTAEEKYFIPVVAHDIQTMSISYLIDEDTPMVWRGPMVSSALQQLLMQTQWDDLDLLLIDMPPGTGDIQLTLSQKVPVDGAIVVTTPQDIALLDAKKGIEMFRKVDIPVLGIIENMSVHVCSNCGHVDPIFGEGGGDKMAEQYQTKLLGQLPLAMPIRVQADSGTPIVIAEPESEYASLYQRVAASVSEVLANHTQAEAPFINIMDD